MSNKLKICHIFVHLFKIGGGETYIHDFQVYNKFDEHIFINEKYKNECIYKFNNILYYKNYINLNELLIQHNYDIIIDHQLYWFDFEISNITFLNINKNKIIHITHGVPIHYKDITQLNYYYSIELYKEYNSDKSWNNHLKIYNNLGVSIQNNIKINNILNNTINIAIVGRINTDKLPTQFLNTLIKFIQIYKNYNFNFYGTIDDTFMKYFLTKIVNNKNKNIFYKGFINPNDKNNIYIENDILIHPSLMEAGATAILEAMSFGLPVIGKKTNGIINALGENNELLCNNDNDIFCKLLSINNSNYKNISIHNHQKILKYNDKNIHFNKLFSFINLIHKHNIENDIPNIIHYIYGLQKNNTEFPFVYYLSILSNKIINKPDIIYFHYQYLPYGKWWDKTLELIELNYINCTELYWGDKKIIKYAHKADKIRIDILEKYGGIYMDIDTITYRPYIDLLKNNFVVGIQEKNYGKDKKTIYCNAIMFSKKNHKILKEWKEKYETNFDPNGWCEASIHLFSDIINKNENKNEITILPIETFYSPSYNETDKIFENNIEINNELLTLHFWNSFSKKYIENINDFNWSLSNNSLYSKLIKNIENINNEISY